MVAHACGLQPGEFVHTLGDAHLYSNHMDQAEEQLGRTPNPLPKMNLNSKVVGIFDFMYEDFDLQEYNYHPHIPAAVAV
tara:strand:- start:116 stop:352 length:237 start_codon:yes stop_codon:yes gene_type:complete